MANGIRWTHIPFDTVQRTQLSQHTPETIAVEGGGIGDRKIENRHYRKIEVAGVDVRPVTKGPPVKLRSRNKK